MATVGNIKIRIGGDISRLQKSLKRAEYSLQRSGRKMAEIGSRLNSAITLPIIGIGAASLKTAGDFEALEKGMESMMGSAEAAKAEIALLRKEALKPGLNFEQALKGSVRLQAVQIDAEIARRALAGFGNALALVGGTGEQLDGVTLALSQIAAKGKISAEEINQIAERVPQIRQILKDGFGTADTEELQKIGIGFEEFITKSIVELEKLPKAQSGIKNSIENTKLALQEAAALIGKKVAPIFEKISKVVITLVNAFTRLPDGLQENIIKIGLLVAVAGPLLSVLGTMKIVYGSLLGALGGAIGGFGQLFKVQKGGNVISKALALSFKVLAASTSVLSFAINTALTPLASLRGAYGRVLSLSVLVGKAFNYVAVRATFLAGGAILQLGRSFIFLAKVPIKTVSIALTSLGANLIKYGNGLAIGTVLNNANASKSFNKLGAAIGSLGAKIAFMVKNPLKALRLGLLAIGGTISGITIPFGLIAAAIAAFGVAVVANIGPARKWFVNLANTVIDLYNEVTFVRGAIEAIGATFKILFSIGKAVINSLLVGFKAIGKSIIAILKGDFKGLRSAILGGFSEFKNTAAKAGEEIANATNEAIKNTVDQREKIPFITEDDVQSSLDKVSKIAQGIQDKLFGVPNVETPNLPLSDLTTKSFDRNAKGTGGGGSSKGTSSIFNLPSVETLDLIPNKLESIGNAVTEFFDQRDFNLGLQEHIDKVTELGDTYRGLGDTLTPFQSAMSELGTAIGNNLAQGVASFRDFARGVLGAISDVIGGLIKQGVASAAANALKSVPFPFNIAAAGAAGGLAAGLFKGLIAKITPPKLATGGLAFGETLATVGDNFNARIDPEVIAPLSKLKEFIQPVAQAMQVIIPDVRLQGSDFVLMFNRAMQQGHRINNF